MASIIRHVTAFSPRATRGWVTFDEGTSENNRRAKSYRLTAKGRKQLDVETSNWDTLARAVARILRPRTQE